MIVDPLYLAAGGADSSSLFAMGEVFSDVQRICTTAGAALVIVHHWNKTGKGAGKGRMSGAGSEEWGRVLASVEVRGRREEGAASVVDLEWQFVGDEIADTSLRVARRVEANDPDDLGSSLRYQVHATTETAPAAYDGPKECVKAVVALFEDVGGEMSKSTVIDRLRKRDLRYRDKVISDSLEVLAGRSVLCERQGPRNARLYSMAAEDGANRDLCPPLPTSAGRR